MIHYQNPTDYEDVETIGLTRWSWTWLVFAPFLYFSYKRVWWHALFSLLACSLTYFISNVPYAFFARTLIRRSYEKSGWIEISDEQLKEVRKGIAERKQALRNAKAEAKVKAVHAKAETEASASTVLAETSENGGTTKVESIDAGDTQQETPQKLDRADMAARSDDKKEEEKATVPWGTRTGTASETRSDDKKEEEKKWSDLPIKERLKAEEKAKKELKAEKEMEEFKNGCAVFVLLAVIGVTFWGCYTVYDSLGFGSEAACRKAGYESCEAQEEDQCRAAGYESCEAKKDAEWDPADDPGASETKTFRKLEKKCKQIAICSSSLSEFEYEARMYCQAYWGRDSWFIGLCSRARVRAAIEKSLGKPEGWSKAYQEK